MMRVDKIINPFGRVYYYPTCCSTMQLNPSHELEGSLVITDYQYGGVGRFSNRKWLSHDGENILLTLHLASVNSRLPIQFFVISALHQLVADYTGLSPQIKWPNDLLVNNKKIAGILCRYQNSLIAIGLGLNINQTCFSDAHISSLSLLLGSKYDREILLNNFLYRLKKLIESGLTCNDINPYLYNRGLVVSYFDGSEVIEGVSQGIDEWGRLSINTPHGLYTLVAGEEVER